MERKTQGEKAAELEVSQVEEMTPHQTPRQVSWGTDETALAPQSAPTLVVHRPLGAGHHQEEIHHRTSPTTQATQEVRAVTSRT